MPLVAALRPILYDILVLHLDSWRISDIILLYMNTTEFFRAGAVFPAVGDRKLSLAG